MSTTAARVNIQGGGPVLPISGISSNVTLGVDQYTAIVDATAGARIITLPVAGAVPGRIYIIKKGDASANTVTVTPQAGNTIDGVASVVISVQNADIIIQSDGIASWHVLSSAVGGSGGMALLGSVISTLGDTSLSGGPPGPLVGMLIPVVLSAPKVVLLSYNLIYHYLGVPAAAPVNLAVYYAAGGPPIEIGRFGSAPATMTVADVPFAGTVPISLPAGPTSIILLGSQGFPGPFMLKGTASVPAFMSVIG